MNESQIERAEQILGYAEVHVIDGAPHPDTTGRAAAFTLEDSLALLRELLPEWSAYKVCTIGAAALEVTR